MAHPSDADRSRPTGSRPRRRFSAWTFLAPIGVLVLFVAVFQAAGNSCVISGCDDSKEDTAETAGPANDLKIGATYMVRDGNTLGSIAERFNLTQEELIACNPTVDAQTLQPGKRLKVSALDCEGKDKAETGANPDPLAGETSSLGTGNTPENNGTAAADPSAGGTGDKTGVKDASAESGDEG